MSERADVLLSRRSVEDPIALGLAPLATSHGSAENMPARIRAAALKTTTAAEQADRAFERAADAHGGY
jgi:hypothetical protein